MDEQAPPGVVRPWTVKAMPEDLTRRVAAAARRRQETVAELVTRALVRELDGPSVMRPADRPVIDSKVNNADAAELVRVAIEWCTTFGSSDENFSTWGKAAIPIVAEVNRLLRARLREARGKPRRRSAPPLIEAVGRPDATDG